MTRLAALLFALLAVSCSVIDPTFTASTPGQDGQRPVQVRVAFEGNGNAGDAELRSAIADLMLDLSRDPTRESAVYDAALEIEDHYRANGFPVTTVEYRYVPVAEDAAWPKAVDVTFVVHEGPQVTVRMHLRGNEAHTKAELLALWQRRRAGVAGLGGDLFVEADIHSFAEALRDFYRARGRIDATVAVPEIVVDLAAAEANVLITIDEGHVHTIRSAEVAASLREALGDDVPPPPIGEPRTTRTIDTWRVALRDELRRRGHREPTVEVVADADPTTPFDGRLHANGEPGPIAQITAVTIAGNQRTLDSTIVDRIAFAAGERYDGNKIDRTIRRLYTTGLFRRVDLAETLVDDDPTRVAITVQVEEQDSRTLELQAGYGSYELLRGGVRLEERNVFGTGKGLALETRASLKGYSANVTATDPDFLSTDTTLTVSGEIFRREEPSFTDNAIGGTLAFSRQIASRLTTRIGYTYAERTDPIAFTALPRDRLVDFTEGRVFVELHNDRRDSVLFPRSGHSEFVSFERFSPDFGASVDLDRITFRSSRYFELSPILGLALRAEIGALWPHDGSAAVPLQERWFNGGENSVRSFRESQLGPKDGSGQPIGGEFRNLFGMEFRTPLWRSLEAAVFVDAGNVGSEIADFGFDRMGYGLGTGLRWLLPIGPVRFDAAWNPDRAPGDVEWAFHLSVGYPF